MYLSDFLFIHFLIKFKWLNHKVRLIENEFNRDIYVYTGGTGHWGAFVKYLKTGNNLEGKMGGKGKKRRKEEKGKKEGKYPFFPCLI